MSIYTSGARSVRRSANVWIPICAIAGFVFSSIWAAPEQAGRDASVLELPLLRVITDSGERIDPEVAKPVVPSGTLQTGASDLLRRTPSVSVATAGDGEGAPFAVSIRGRDPMQTRFFVDGISWSDFQYQNAPVHLIPSSALAGADVYAEGPPALSGDDGLGGGIDFRLRPLRPERSASRLSLRAGSFGDLQAVWEQPFAAPRARLILSLARSRDDFAFADDNGTPYNVHDDRIGQRSVLPSRAVRLLPQIDLGRIGSHRLEWTSLHAWRETGLAGVGFAEDSVRSDELFHFFHLKMRTLGADPNALLADWFAFWNQAHVGGTGVGLSKLVRARSIRLGGRVQAGVDLSKSLKAVAAVNPKWESYSAHDVALATVENRRLCLPLSFSLPWTVSPTVSVVPEVLAQHIYTNGRGFSGADPSRRFSFFSPRLRSKFGLGSNLEGMSSIGRYFRAPSSFELYGSPTGIEANEELKEESAWQGSVGLAIHPASGKAWKVAWSGSFSEAVGQVAFVRTSQNMMSARNIDRSQIFSSELELGVRPRPLSLSFAVSWMKTLNLSEIPYAYLRELPLRAQWRTYAEVGWDRGPWQASYRFEWTSSRYADLANLKKIGSFGEHSFGLSWNGKRWGNLRAEIRNLGDATTVESQFENLRAYDYTTGISGVPAAGRRIYLSWSVSV